MSKEGLNQIVTRLMTDRRLQSEFGRDPAKAAAAYELTIDELEAVKRGDQHELLHFGLDPAIFEQAPAKRPRLASIVSTKPGRVVAAALIALTLAAMPMATHAAGPQGTASGRRTAGARLSGIRFFGPNGLRTSLRRTSSARVRAVRARVRARHAYASGLNKALGNVACVKCFPGGTDK